VNRLERLYALTEEVRRHEPAPISAAYLADRLGVTRRTIERDLASLRAAGVPLKAARGRGGGYTLDPGVSWTPVALNPAEVTALLLAQTAAPGIPFGRAAQTATAKLVDSLPAATRAEMEHLRQTIRVVIDAPAVTGPVATTIEEAVRLGRVARIDFTDRHGTQTSREVEPVGFYGSLDGWSLIAWCRLREAGRLFRLDRIGTAVLTTEQALPRDVDETLGWAPGPISRIETLPADS
jgi:predicted DNA-binding transcriptional regulator YafY